MENTIDLELQNIFNEMSILEKKRLELNKQFDEIENKIDSIAFNLYQEFMENNKTFDINTDYYKIYIENGYFLAEELYFHKRYDNFIEFKHKSPYRANHSVSVYFNVEKEDYTSNSVVIDNEQFKKLSENFEIRIRE